MSLCLVAALLAALFLRSVGIVGHRKVIRHVDSDQTMVVRPDEPNHANANHNAIDEEDEMPDSPVDTISTHN
jgi:hypothetical protein